MNEARSWNRSASTEWSDVKAAAASTSFAASQASFDRRGVCLRPDAEHGAVEQPDVVPAVGRIEDVVEEELRSRKHRVSGDKPHETLPVLTAVGTDLLTGDRVAFSDSRAEFSDTDDNVTYTYGPAVQQRSST